MVTPIVKIRNTIKCEQYHPINTLRTCEKIIEKIVKHQFEEYFEKYNLLLKYQSDLERGIYLRRQLTM